VSKYSQSQTAVAARDKMFMSILTLSPLFIYQIENFFKPKWSVKRALQSLKGENIPWEPYVLVADYT